MFTEEIFYGIRCDRCGEQYESSGDYSYMTDKGEILETAENDDWREIDGKHYCPGCYVEDPEPIDDDHEYMPKTAYPDCIYGVRRIVAELLESGSGKIEEKDEKLHLCFYLNNHELDDVLKGAIDQKMHGVKYSTEVEEKQRQHYKDRLLHIFIPFQNIVKGDYVKIVKHSVYNDCFGKEGKVIAIRNQRLFVVQIFNVESSDPHFFTMDALERIDKKL